MSLKLVALLLMYYLAPNSFNLKQIFTTAAGSVKKSTASKGKLKYTKCKQQLLPGELLPYSIYEWIEHLPNAHFTEARPKIEKFRVSFAQFIQKLQIFISSRVLHFPFFVFIIMNIY